MSADTQRFAADTDNPAMNTPPVIAMMMLDPKDGLRYQGKAVTKIELRRPTPVSTQRTLLITTEDGQVYEKCRNTAAPTSSTAATGVDAMLTDLGLPHMARTNLLSS